MATITGKLALDSIARVRCSRMQGNSYISCEGRRLTGYAVGHPPFGIATPGGEISLVIAADDAVALLDQVDLNDTLTITLTIDQAESEVGATPEIPDAPSPGTTALLPSLPEV